MKDIDPNTLSAARSGSTEAFDEVVRCYLPLVFHYIARLTNNGDLAQDLTQETFLRAWKHLKTFDTKKPLRPWLMQIARNITFDALRRKRVVPFSNLSLTEYSTIEAMLDPAMSPLHHAERNETIHAARQVLEKLTALEREVLTLRYLEELSLSEMTDVLGLPLETVRSRLRRARAAFRGIYEPGLTPSSVVDSEGTYDQTTGFQTNTQKLASNYSNP